MVLGELSGGIVRALANMSNATIVDQKVVTGCLDEISRALMQADVSMDLLKIKVLLNRSQNISFHFLLQRYTGKPSFTPEKGKPSVIMFVGLQGSGKTTSCIKYAYYHKKKGFKPAIVCADTFRAGAFDQLKQGATKAMIPFFGSYEESDPVKVALEGVETFKKENFDLIIVDTSGRHQQEASLFEEMRQLAEATKPDLVIFVMDSSIGQSAFDQAQAFNRSVSVGAVIITKTEGAAKGGGALSAVAATKSPVIFLGTGERMDDFEIFDVKPFVSRLLGIGDWSGFLEKIHDVVPMDHQSELLQKVSKGKFTLRTMQEQYQSMLNMGPMNQVLSMLPGSGDKLMPKGGEKERQSKIKVYMSIMDSMTNEELDSTNPKIMNDTSRIMRVARGSGRQPKDVMDLLAEYKRVAKVWGMVKGFKTCKKGLNAQHMSKVLPAHLLNQMGGMGAIQNLIKQMG
ncbi:hypothetical protein MKW94_014263 [Papaver nudicaule]|uniref:Signal recognition particle 54 kDa protein n=1 Tax=Papaver nudicaule TaxID=74823 RepID=A0AA41S6P7_PAPNU|nr:hypothetical protein [Papaver nudicaule]